MFTGLVFHTLFKLYFPLKIHINNTNRLKVKDRVLSEKSNSVSNYVERDKLVNISFEHIS